MTTSEPTPTGPVHNGTAVDETARNETADAETACNETAYNQTGGDETGGDDAGRTDTTFHETTPGGPSSVRATSAGAVSVREWIRVFLDPRPVRWPTVLLLAAAMAGADGFVLTALTGAVGAIERTQGLFFSWLVDSALLLPLFALAVLFVLARGRRREESGRTPRRVLTSVLLVAVAGTAVGLAAVVASSAYDYHLQAAQLEQTGALHDHTVPGSPEATAAAHAGHDSCSETCQQERLTLTADLRGVGLAGPILLITNLLSVGWLVALLGGRLSAPPRRPAVPAPSEAGD